MKKSIRLLTLVMVLVLVCAAFMPSTLAISGYPYPWENLFHRQTPESYTRGYMLAAQVYLRNALDAPLPVTGTFDTATLIAVHAFQDHFGITVTDAINFPTWAAMYDNLYSYYIGEDWYYKVNSIYTGETSPFVSYRWGTYNGYWYVNLNTESVLPYMWSNFYK